MIDRAKYFWEKVALVLLVVLFILFEVKMIVVVHEIIIEIFIGILNLYLFVSVIKKFKRYMELRW